MQIIPLSILLYVSPPSDGSLVTQQIQHIHRLLIQRTLQFHPCSPVTHQDNQYIPLDKQYIPQDNLSILLASLVTHL